MRIEPLQNDEIAEFFEWRGGTKGNHWLTSALKDEIGGFQAQTRFIFLAKAENEWIGTVQFTLCHDDAQLADGQTRGYLQALEVVEPWRRRGVGTALIQHVLQEAQAKNLEAITLAVAPDSPARALYEKLGFAPFKTAIFHWEDADWPVVCLMKSFLTTQPLSFEASLEIEENSPVRHEYIDGQLSVRQGRPPIHCEIIANLGVAVATRLRRLPFRATMSEVRVRFPNGDDWVYPDVLIRDKNGLYHKRDEIALLNPRAVFEVFARDTQHFILTKKFDLYRTLPSLSDCIFVWADETRVEHFRKAENGDWIYQVSNRIEGELKLDNFGISAPLAEIYEDIEFEQTGLPFEDEE